MRTFQCANYANDVNRHIPPPTELSESESDSDEDKRPKRRPKPRSHYDPGLISDAGAPVLNGTVLCTMKLTNATRMEDDFHPVFP